MGSCASLQSVEEISSPNTVNSTCLQLGAGSLDHHLSGSMDVTEQAPHTVVDLDCPLAGGSEIASQPQSIEFPTIACIQSDGTYITSTATSLSTRARNRGLQFAVTSQSCLDEAVHRVLATSRSCSCSQLSVGKDPSLHPVLTQWSMSMDDLTVEAEVLGLCNDLNRVCPAVVRKVD